MNKTIMIVDDEFLIMKLLVKRLEANGFTVVSATNGREALEMIGKDKPDLILLDIMMPEMDGHEVLRHLKASEDTRGIPVIMVSAHGQMEAQEKAKEGGAVDFLKKPFRAEALMEKIEKII